jgi:hypothetical protein
MVVYGVVCGSAYRPPRAMLVVTMHMSTIDEHKGALNASHPSLPI